MGVVVRLNSGDEVVIIFMESNIASPLIIINGGGVAEIISFRVNPGKNNRYL